MDPEELKAPLPERQDEAPGFLRGGGELGARMRAFDWEDTPLGPPAEWPQSLKTAVRIMLTSRQPIWIGWGEHLTYLYNDAYRSIIGGKHPWALGRPTREVWSEIWADIAPLLDAALRGDQGTYVEAQLLIMERSGYPEETYYTFSYSPIPNDRGEAGGIICANTDDTLRVTSERQLALLRDLATALANPHSGTDRACESAANALRGDTRDLPFAMIYFAEPDGGSLSLKGATGIEPGSPTAPSRVRLDEASTWPLAKVVHDHEIRVVDALATRFATAFPSGAWKQPPASAALIPIPARGDTGRPGVLVVGLNPFRLFDGDYRRFLELAAGQIGAGIANAQAYEEERRRAEALAEIDRAKTAFFSNVSHEFRTPLTLILGPLEDALNNPALPAGDRERLEVAHRNSLRMLKLVNSLLDFSRIEAGRAKATFRATDLAAFTTELASNFESACARAGLQFVIDCPPLQEPVYVDRDMWEMIVLNLLSNAFKFTFEGRITVRLRALDGRAELMVRDTGVGVPRAELPRLFERFHRIDGQRSRTHEGSGIGLALVQELVKLQGGNLRADSEPGSGTGFFVDVPLGEAHLQPERIVGEAGAMPSSQRARAWADEALSWLPDAGTTAAVVPHEAGTAAVSHEGARILVADDNLDMRNYVCRLLARVGAVEAVPDGQAALEAIRRQRPDLVLTDVMMPRLDGFQLLEAIRSDPTLRDLPVILLSARAGADARVEGLGAGADDYLNKPFSAQELIARIGANLALGSLRREAMLSLRATEERQSFLLELADSIAALADPTLIKQAAARLLGLHLHVDRVAWFEVEGRHYAIEGDYTDGMPSICGRHPVDSFGPRLFEAYRSGRVVSCRDVETDPDVSSTEHAGFAGIHTRAYIGAPLIRNGEFVAGLAVHSAEPREWKGEELDLVREVAERTWAVIERGRAEEAVRRQTLRLERLDRIGKALASDLDLERIVQIVTDSATVLTGAQFGAFIYNVTDERGNPGFSFTVSGAPREAFEKLGIPHATAIFGPTYRGEGILRSDDIRADPRYGKSPPHFGLPEGHPPVVSYLAVPVISRSGKVHGGLFFGHGQPGMFTAESEHIATGIASHAALAIDNAVLLETARTEVEQRERAESMEAAQRRVLELSVADAPLETVLDTLVRTIEAQSRAGMLGSILLLDPDGRHLRHGAAPSLPQAYLDALDGMLIGPMAGSCGTAAFRKQPVEVSDIDDDPLWAGFRDLAAAHGLKACWSLPILSSRGKVLGTFAMYYRVAQSPISEDMRLVESGTRTAALVIER
ncbi:MAG: GAF domain-containing protein, partial [Rhodanobacteraceae bacterium]